jgi:ketosteroid isomerase-like protein
MSDRSAPASPLTAKALALLHRPASAREAGRPPAAADGTQGRAQLQDALCRTEAAIRAITTGEPHSYIALWDDSPDISLFGAWGPIERGPDALRSTFEWVGRRFGPAGGLSCELTAVHLSGSLACTVGFEHGTVQVDGRAPAPMRIRVTHLYRHTRGEWRLIHRHADFPPVTNPEIAPSRSAAAARSSTDP